MKENKSKSSIDSSSRKNILKRKDNNWKVLFKRLLNLCLKSLTKCLEQSTVLWGKELITSTISKKCVIIVLLSFETWTERIEIQKSRWKSLKARSRKIILVFLATWNDYWWASNPNVDFKISCKKLEIVKSQTKKDYPWIFECKTFERCQSIIQKRTKNTWTEASLWIS